MRQREIRMQAEAHEGQCAEGDVDLEPGSEGAERYPGGEHRLQLAGAAFPEDEAVSAVQTPVDQRATQPSTKLRPRLAPLPAPRARERAELEPDGLNALVPLGVPTRGGEPGAVLARRVEQRGHSEGGGDAHDPDLARPQDRRRGPKERRSDHRSEHPAPLDHSPLSHASRP